MTVVKVPSPDRDVLASWVRPPSIRVGLRAAGSWAPRLAGPATPLEDLLERYERHLVEDRGPVVSTVVGYVGVARRFLSERALATGDETGVAGLCAGVVTAFLLRECGRLGSGTSPTIPASARRRCLAAGMVRARACLISAGLAEAAPASRSAILASTSLRSQSLGMVSATARARSIGAAAWAG